MAALASAGIGAGLGLIGTWMQGRQQAQQREMMQQFFNQLMGQAQAGDTRAIEALSQITPFINDTSHRANAMLWGDQGNNGSINDLQNWLNQTRPGAQGDVFGAPFTGDAFNEQIGNILGIGQMPRRNNAFADSVYDAQGKTDISGAVADRSMDIGLGKGAAMDELMNKGLGLLYGEGRSDYSNAARGMTSNLFQDQGFNPALRGVQNQANAISQASGFTPGLSRLSELGGNAAEGSFGIEGLTPTGAAAQGTALETLLQGGENAATDYLTQRGAELSGKDALIPMDQRIALARDMAGTQGIKTYANILKKAMQRGGGPANLMAGNQNQVMAEFGDELLQSEAKAVREAMTDQQRLQLEEQGQGFGALGRGQDIATARTGQAGDLASKLENASTARFNVGGGFLGDAERQASQRVFEALGLIPATENVALSRLRTGADMGQGADALDLSRMQFGGNLLDRYNQTRLQGLNQAMTPEQFHMANLFGASNLRNATADTMGNQFNNFLNAGKFNTDQTRAFYDILGGAQSSNAALQKMIADLGLQSSGQGVNVGQIFAGMANSARGGATGAMGGAAGMGQQSPWGNFFQGAGQGVAQGSIPLPRFGGGGYNPGINEPGGFGG